jgi:hypothetical protein
MVQTDSRLRRHAALWLAAQLIALAIMVAATPVAAGQGQSGNQRPLSDWLSQQGTTSVFFPPAPDLVDWSNTDAKLVGPKNTADCFPVETMFIQILGHRSRESTGGTRTVLSREASVNYNLTVTPPAR